MRARYGIRMNKIRRAIVEAGFIVFLFYSNLLMGEFEGSGLGRSKGLAWAIGNIFTASNFAIAVVSALIGHFLIEFFRENL
jgi:hypothetical protein